MDDDYIYRTEDYLSLDGNKNKTKRGSLNWFERNYPGVKIVYWDGINEKIKNDRDVYKRQACICNKSGM